MLTSVGGSAAHLTNAGQFFSDLGQLSFFGPVSTDEQAWEMQPYDAAAVADDDVAGAKARVG